MSKREEMRRQRKNVEKRNKILVIGGVTVFAILVIAIIVISQLKPGINIVKTTPVAMPQENGMSMGNPDAPVKVDIYSDFQCPACMRFAQNIEPQLVDKYVKAGKVFVTYHPFNVIGPESDTSAEAAYCAADQNKFWSFHDILYANWTGENVGDFTAEKIKKYAEAINLDLTAFNQCFDSGKYKEKVQADQKAGEAIPLSYTPSIVINGKLDESGNYLATIDAALAGK
jgi:protein-disulfide isomerase